MAAPDDGAADSGDVERYEALRRGVLEGRPDGWRLGLALLQRKGVASWMRMGRSLPAQPVARPQAAGGVVGGELVGVLANMALVCARTG
ncbi:MAG: hypothetical protein ACYCZV_16700 [Acidimicrobiales bacterium]